MFTLTTLVVAACAILRTAALPAPDIADSKATIARFFPTINKTDTNGNLIQAHGGDIIQQDDYFYWFGENKVNETTSGHFISVNCYRSTDFINWEYRGPALSPINGTNISTTMIVERPKVLYNKKNDEYVMWFHNDSPDYGFAMVGVATSKTIDGAYDWRGSFRPWGNFSRDQTVWVDTDGTAYYAYATTNNADLQISRLDADFYNVEAVEYTWRNVYWEAPGFLKINSTYFIFYSRQDGWTPTDNYYLTATNMSGPWSSPVLLAPPGTYAFDTQNAYDIVIQGTKQTTYLYYGDQWNAPNLGSSTYAFYPMVYNGSALSLHQTGGWKLNLKTGEWHDIAYTQLLPTNKNVKVTPYQAIFSCPGGCPEDSLATINMKMNTTVSFKWHGSKGAKTIGFEYLYNCGKNVWYNLPVSVDGVTIGDALLESTRTTTLYQEAPVAATLESGSTVEFAVNATGGCELYIASIKVYHA